MTRKSKTLVLLGLSLALVYGGNGQSIVSIDPIGFEDDGLAGNIVGTGPDGTTYVLTGTQFGSEVTMTLVEDGFHVSETADIPTGTDTLHVGIQCELGSDSALCTQIIHVGDVATTTVISGENEPTAVQVGSGALGGSGATTPARTTITSLSLTTTDTSTSESVLPPVVSGESTASSPLSSPSSSSVAGSTLPIIPSQSVTSAASSNMKASVGILSGLLLFAFAITFL